MEPLIQMNKFHVVDMPGMKTVAFVVERNSENMETSSGMYLQKLDCIDINDQGKIKKEFNVIKSTEDEKQTIVLLTLTRSKAILSTGELDSTGFKAIDTNVPLSYGSLYNSSSVEYKEVNYTPDMKRCFSVIDAQTGEEIRPVLYNDPISGMVKGKCKILPNKPYVVLEIVDD